MLSVMSADFIPNKFKRRTSHKLSWAEIGTLACCAVVSIVLTLLAQNLWPMNTPPLSCLEIHSENSEKNPSEERPLKNHKPYMEGLHSKRAFTPVGSGAALFVIYGAYRGGPNTFAIVGLGLKPLHVFGSPEFQCFWAPGPNEEPIVKSKTARSMLPDYGYGRVYTVVVVNCTFEIPVGTGMNGTHHGGALLLDAYHGDGLGKAPERLIALTEDANAYKQSTFEPPYRYEYLYCGSPLFGHLNARRIREWIAYHIRLFGPRSHFFFHDAGGMNADVRHVLEPWERLGFVTIEDVTEQAQYDGYYCNQFLILNDCLHKTRFLSSWTFFFDVDEYIYISPEQSFSSVMHQFENHSELQFQQCRMSEKLCQDNQTIDNSR